MRAEGNMVCELPMSKPTGVNIVGVLTLFSSIQLMYLSFNSGFLNFESFASVNAGATVTSIIYTLYVAFAPMLAMFSFVTSVVLLTGQRSKYVWYAMIFYSIALLCYFAYFEREVFGTYFGVLSQMVSLKQVDWGQFGGILPFIGSSFVYLTPFLYSVVCIRYFLTRIPKRYFGVC